MGEKGEWDELSQFGKKRVAFAYESNARKARTGQDTRKTDKNRSGTGDITTVSSIRREKR